MRYNYQRHLGYLFNKSTPHIAVPSTFAFIADVIPKSNTHNIPPEFNPRDWLGFLLHIDAELEHSLMVQYLYAAYSMGGDQIAAEDRERVRCWQEIILGIAKEEMGHFVSVQNVLRVIGAPLHFDRQDFPWDSELYPFEFKLEPLTLASLAKYIYAESPKGWLNTDPQDDLELKEIKKEIKELLAADSIGDPISVLFEKIIALLEDADLISDDVFLSETYPFQAKFDEWGRGYAAGARGNSSKGSPEGTPDVLVAPLLSRTDALNAVRSIAEQGEDSSEGNTLSHFERFLGIYKEWRVLPKGFNPSKNIAINPTIGELPDTQNTQQLSAEESMVVKQKDLITDPIAQGWAHLFNVRYRMLLTFLTHSFLISDGFDNAGANSARGVIIHATFGEMYNLRSIARVLVNTSISLGSDKMAGPTFEIPYTIDLPIGEVNRWRKHLDLIEASGSLIDILLNMTDPSLHQYLIGLKAADRKLSETAQKITTATA